MTWKYSVLCDLHEAGLRGRLPDFISEFLNKRCFCVHVHSCFSDICDQDMGVPQSRHFICFFVYIEINSFIKFVPVDVRGLQYVNDFCMCFRSKSLIASEREIQWCLTSIQKLG